MLLKSLLATYETFKNIVAHYAHHPSLEVGLIEGCIDFVNITLLWICILNLFNHMMNCLDKKENVFPLFCH